jgi:hypothetical protein
MVPDADVIEMLKESIGVSKFKNFDSLTIEQKMVSSAMKKYQINNEFEETLKEVAYDCDINKKGNIIRLEEHIRPLSNGKYQIYFKNTKTLENFVREGIPSQLTFKEILDRIYSYPNDSNLPLKFYEVQVDNDNTDIFVNVVDEDTGKFNILEQPIINKNLTMYENVKCWNSDLTLEKVFDKINLNPENHDIISYFMRIKNNFDLYPILRKEILGEKNLGNRIEFKNVQKLLKGKQRLMKCLTILSESDLTPKIQQRQLKKLLQSTELKSKINSKIIDIVYKYRYLHENMIEKLQELDSKSLNDILKEAEYYNSQIQKTV